MGEAPARLGLVGCGIIAQEYLAWITGSYPDQLRVVACADVDQARAQETAARFSES